MSRVPRLIVPETSWVRGLRACLRHIKQADGTLFLVQGTAGWQLIRRGVERLGIPYQSPPEYVSQRAKSLGSERRPPDEVLVDSVERILALGIRPLGNIHRLLTESPDRARRTTVVIVGDMQSSEVVDQLISLGAQCWTPAEQELNAIVSPQEVSIEDHCVELAQPELKVFPITTLMTPGEWSYLTHTTRACPAPWPRQSMDNYCDAILDGSEQADHSALGTLKRIVSQKLLIGSHRVIRGGFDMVSLTAVPWSFLPGLSCFRTHRNRWDFEPYGVCLRKSALERLGARSVIYGSEQDWQKLSADDRPYFQLSRSGVEQQSNQDRIDWTVEQEWRFAGDLDLRQFDPSDVTVFVPSFEEARQIVPRSPWPVTLWPVPRSGAH